MQIADGFDHCVCQLVAIVGLDVGQHSLELLDSSVIGRPFIALHCRSSSPSATAASATPYTHVQPGGHYDFVFPPGRELWIEDGTRLGCRLVSPAQDHNYSGRQDTS